MLNRLVLRTPLVVLSLVFVAILKLVEASSDLGLTHTVLGALCLGTLFVLILVQRSRYAPYGLGLPFVAVLAILSLLLLPSLFLVQSVDIRGASRYVLAMALTSMLLGLGSLIGHRAYSRARMGRLTEVIDRWVQEPIDFKANHRLAWLIGVVSAFAALATIYYFIIAPRTPLIGLVSGDLSVTLRDRTDALAGLPIPQPLRYLLYWTRSTFYPLLLGVVSVRLLRTRRLKWLVVFVVLLAVAVAFVGANTEKAPVLALALTVSVVVAIYRRMNIRLISAAVVGGAIALAFPFLMYVVLASTASSAAPINQAYKNLVSRVVVVPSRVAMVHFEVFPDSHPFLAGSSIRGLNAVVGKPHFPLARFLYATAAPAELNAAPNPNGNLNAAFPSEMWANFGWLGVICTAVIVGVGLQALEMWVKARKKSPFVVAAYATLLVATINLVSVNVTTVFFSGGYVVVYALLRVGSSQQPMAPERPGNRYSSGIYLRKV